MPQPFPKHLKEAQFRIGHAPLERPNLCYLGMTVVIAYASLEVALSTLFTTMLGSNPSPAVAILGVIKNNNLRNEAFRAVAETTLSPKNFQLLNAVLATCDTADKERNRIAHWVWAVEAQLPEAVALLDPRKIASIQHKYSVLAAPSATPSFEAIAALGNLIRDSALIYKTEDFEVACGRVTQATTLVITLSIVVGHPDGHPEGTKARKMLLDAPEIKQWLAKTANMNAAS